MIQNKPAKNIEGFDVYAPELTLGSDTFISGAHTELENYEKTYFWFSARRDLIYWLVSKYFSGIKSYCEIGCGGGFLLSGLRRILPKTDIYGTEIFISGLKIARKRFAEGIFFQSDILNFPYLEEFDLIGVYDVIEHIEDDTRAIQSIYNALKPGGGVIITVPQHKWLWTKNDEYSCHKRRYSRKDLIKKCSLAGFDIVRVTSFTSLLLPAFIVNCLLNRNKTMDQQTISEQFRINPILNGFFALMCQLELALTKSGVNFPFGGSLVCILRK